MEERQYQLDAPNRVHEALKEGHRRICIVSPTGTGKTHIVALILRDPKIREFLGVHDRPIRCLFTAHRHHLLSNAVETYSQYDDIEIIPHMVSAGTANQEINCDFDVVIGDEIHHESMSTFQLQLEQLTKAPLIGITATEERDDRRILKFSKFIHLIDRETATEKGYIAQSVIHSFIVPAAWCRVSVSAEIIDLLGSELGQTMMFTRTKKDAHQLHNLLKDRNLTSDLVIDCSKEVVEQKLNDFAQKKHQYNISCAKLDEGTDVKGCETSFFVRRTNSKRLMNQTIGRSVRPDCSSTVVEMIDPLGGNLVATDIVTNPSQHYMWYKVKGKWKQDRIR